MVSGRILVVCDGSFDDIPDYYALMFDCVPSKIDGHDMIRLEQVPRIMLKHTSDSIEEFVMIARMSYPGIPIYQSLHKNLDMIFNLHEQKPMDETTFDSRLKPILR